MLPGMDGFTVCRKLREQLNIPILMVTAKREDIDKIVGLGTISKKRFRRAFWLQESKQISRSIGEWQAAKMYRQRFASGTFV